MPCRPLCRRKEPPVIKGVSVGPPTVLDKRNPPPVKTSPEGFTSSRVMRNAPPDISTARNELAKKKGAPRGSRAQTMALNALFITLTCAAAFFFLLSCDKEAIVMWETGVNFRSTIITGGCRNVK